MIFPTTLVIGVGFVALCPKNMFRCFGHLNQSFSDFNFIGFLPKTNDFIVICISAQVTHNPNKVV